MFYTIYFQNNAQLWPSTGNAVRGGYGVMAISLQPQILGFRWQVWGVIV